ncbi:MAG: hypothetical protein AAGD86_13805, partial [Pseudomonadota bacterium]
MNTWTRGLCAAAALLFSAPGVTLEIDAARGADPSVNYAELTYYGPWDERNYALTAKDLALLSDNERELSEGIPAFYRVELRRQYPDLMRTGPVQYPRSALPWFFVKHTGFKIGDRFYRKAQREADGSWNVITSAPVAELDDKGQVRSLEGEVRVTSPAGAAESTIEVSPINPDILVAGSNGPGTGQRMHFSSDGGESWTQSAPLPLGG